MSQTGADTEKDLTASVESAKKEISHKNGSDKEIRSIRLLYIISAVLLSPISGFIADLFRIGNRYMILLTYYNNNWSYKSMTSQSWFTRACYLSYNGSSDWNNVHHLGTLRPLRRLLSMLSL